MFLQQHAFLIDQSYRPWFSILNNPLMVDYQVPIRGLQSILKKQAE